MRLATLKLLVLGIALVPCGALAAEPVAVAATPSETAPGPEALKPPSTTVSSAVSDATYQVLHDRVVTLQTKKGETLTGLLLSVEPDAIALALSGPGTVVMIKKGDVTSVALWASPAPPAAKPAETPAAKPAETPARHGVGLQLGLATPSLMVDVDYHNVYAFANFAILWPMIDKGWWAFSGGIGGTFAPVKGSHFLLDVFMHFSPMRGLGNEGEWALSFGLGVGFHYTWDSGLTLAVKVPVVGYGWNLDGNSNNGAVTYYLAAATSLPFFSMGYRF